MNDSKQSALSVFKTAMVVGGAYAAYNIGSGFATGAEVLQFFGSWGSTGTWISVGLCILITAYACTSAYRLGSKMNFAAEKDAYSYYCGKWGAKFFDYFTLLTAFLYCISMFAGCGVTINQYFGIPVYVGAVILGVVSVIVASFGLKRIIDAIGWLGLVIIAFVVFLGIYSLCVSDVGFVESQARMSEYVANGNVLQAGAFGMHNPVISAVSYCGMNFMISLPILMGMAKRFHNSREALGGGLASALLFGCAILLVLCAVLTNIDYIVEIGAQVPNLAVVQRILPALQPVFALVIVLGIFTTVTGYLWLLAGRFIKEKSKGYMITIIVVAVLGVFGGSVIPFNTLINIIYPYTGLVGLVLLGFAVYRDICPRKDFTAERAEDK